MPMWLLLLIPIVYAAAVLETSLADVIQVDCVAPDLLALVAVIWLLWSTGRWSFLTAGLIGLVGDLIAPGRVGLGMASFLCVGYALARFREKGRPHHLVWQVPAVCLAVTVLAACIATGRWLSGETSVALSTLLLRAVGVGVYTAGVSVPILMVVGWLHKPSGDQRRRALFS
jgi:rod shape-determining protein MreD